MTDRARPMAAPFNRSPTVRIKWSEADGPELLCLYCQEWWSIGEDAQEHWIIGKWAECRLCIRERQRLYQALRRLDPNFAAKDRTYSRHYKQALRRAYPSLVNAYNREMEARRRARERERYERRIAA